MTTKHTRIVIATAFVATTLLQLTTLFGAELKWRFDENDFNARLTADWLVQDEPVWENRAALFTSENDSERERALVAKVLDALEEDEDADAFDGEELDYRRAVAQGATLVDGANPEIDASPAGVDALRKRLDALVASDAPGVNPDWRALYWDACRLRRARRLAEFAADAPQIVYTKHYVMGASHYAYTEDVSDEDYKDFSCNRQPGGQLCLATFQPDGTIRNEVLVESKNGTIRDPDVSWDGKKILFSMRDDYASDDFHIYEYDVEAKKTRQITYGPGVADIEPIYLPNDEIMFGSTRCTQITDCWWTEVSNFYVCDLQGRFLRRVSVDQVTVNYPKLLDDGRIIYTRWDYNDRGQIYPQPLFQMNADATGQTEFYGNNSYFPTTIMHARGIPGSDKVLAIAAGHHTYQNGKALLVDRSKGTQENHGATLVAPIRETPADKIDQYGQVGELFQYPYPLDDFTFLAAYLPEGGAWKYDVPFGLYWFDYDGRRELLAFDPAISCGQPILLQERVKPTTRPSQVDLNKTTGTYYVQDVYEGPGLEGIERGVVKALRVVALEFRNAGIRKNGNSGPAGAAMVCTPPSVSNGSWDVKRVLGEAPVEEDGSAYFEVPALTPVYFQLVDANGDVVQTMRSWSTLQPGETFGCVGCHEPKGAIIENAASIAGGATMALRREPSQLTPPLSPGRGRFQDAGFSFVRDVQPILDAHCVRCHTGEVDADGKTAPFSLRGNQASTPKGIEAIQNSGRLFSESYLNLTQYGNHDGKFVKWIGIQEGPDMLPPYKSGAAKSPLIAMFRDRDNRKDYHKDVQIDDRALRTLALWIDLLVPYCGDYVEENCWTVEERADYEYYQAKLALENGINEFNYELKRRAVNEKNDAIGNESRNIEFGGPLDKRTFMAGYIARRIPSVAKREGKFNEYRNVAYNPRDIQGDAYALFQYPHATTNSEYAFMDEFAAKNVIDGKTENRGHGPNFPSWGPNLRTDLWLKIDFGCEVEIDKVVLYLRADFPHDAAWKTGTLEFSDGSKVDITLNETADAQVFEFPARRVTSVKLTNLKTDSPEKWHGVTEMECWGKSVE
ncbi:MAG: hypothetical protein IJU03_02725 [Thermoguttaceae bacterium]|nr:hypothetical protein [Thermoguttaceae bacterium]